MNLPGHGLKKVEKQWCSETKIRVYIRNESDFNELEDSVYQKPNSIYLYCCQIWVFYDGAMYFIEKKAKA